MEEIKSVYSNSYLHISAGDMLFSLYQNHTNKKYYKLGIRAMENENDGINEYVPFTFYLFSISNVNSQLIGPVMNLPYHFEIEHFYKNEDHYNPEWKSLLAKALINDLRESIVACIFESQWFQKHNLIEIYPNKNAILEGLSDIKRFEEGFYTVIYDVPEKRKLPNGNYYDVLVSTFDISDKIFVVK